MNIRSREGQVKGKAAAWWGGVLFCLPYVAIWGFTVYLNLRLLPRLPSHPPSPIFNLVLNFFQLVPPALFAFVFGWRLASRLHSIMVFRKIVPAYLHHRWVRNSVGFGGIGNRGQ